MVIRSEEQRFPCQSNYFSPVLDGGQSSHGFLTDSVLCEGGQGGSEREVWCILGEEEGMEEGEMRGGGEKGKGGRGRRGREGEGRRRGGGRGGESGRRAGRKAVRRGWNTRRRRKGVGRIKNTSYHENKASHMINVHVVQTDHHGNSPGNRLSPSTCMSGLKGGEEEGEGVCGAEGM